MRLIPSRICGLCATATFAWATRDSAPTDSPHVALVAPLSVINALIVALGLRRKDELSEHFRLMEGIWDEYRVYVGKDRV